VSEPRSSRGAKKAGVVGVEIAPVLDLIEDLTGKIRLADEKISEVAKSPTH
jgi:hypothetical protein